MKKKENKILLLGLGVIAVITFLFGTTYAYWKFQKEQTNPNVIASKCFQLSFVEDSSSTIQLMNAYPMTDEEGSQLKPYTFTLTNQCDNELSYQVNLEILQNTTLKEQYVKTRVNEGSISLVSDFTAADITVEGAKKAYQIAEGTINAKETKSFEVRLWLDGDISADNEETMNQEFYSKVSVVGSYQGYRGRYTEDILNGTDPVLADGLIPVTINETGKVYKADETREWYNYGNKNWANAVILEDESIVYQNGEEIPESNIESYFVWIPRYKYQIFNDGLYYGLSDHVNQSEQEIQIQFENKETRASDGTRKGQWLTHPAFTSFDVNGIWVGKFETGYKGAMSTEAAQSNTYDTTKIEIKPNVYSWRGIQVSNAHLTSYNYKRDMDSHMMKNTEWGAVALLQHSKYGSMTSVRINNNSAYITGYSAVSEPTCGSVGANEDCNKYEETPLGVDGTYTLNYLNPASVISSTTGNYSGIYDMSGGGLEQMMAVMADQNGNPMSGRNDLYNTGFNGTYGCPTCDVAKGNDTSKISLTTGIDFPDSKYYDLYAYSTNDQIYVNRILGDATGEIGPFAYNDKSRQIGSWYADEAWAFRHTYPWMRRGGDVNEGNGTGVFNFVRHHGGTQVNIAYRIVLAF